VPGDDAGHYGPVCGCDGVTYYDDLLALEALVTVRSAGPCDDAAADRCALDGDECATKHGSSSFCSAIVPSGQCLPAPTVGTCWVTPPLCPGTGGTGYGCEDPGNCKAACSIIASQIAWYEAVCEPSGP
jgi:hypothetical protein